MIRFRFFNELDNNLSNRVVEKLEHYLTTLCYLRYSYIYRLHHVENGYVIPYQSNLEQHKTNVGYKPETVTFPLTLFLIPPTHISYFF